MIVVTTVVVEVSVTVGESIVAVVTWVDVIEVVVPTDVVDVSVTVGE